MTSRVLQHPVLVTSSAPIGHCGRYLLLAGGHPDCLGSWDRRSGVQGRHQRGGNQSQAGGLPTQDAQVWFGMDPVYKNAINEEAIRAKMEASLPRMLR